MPTPLFLGLDSEKQHKIFMAGVSEFAEYGYENSSTNQIVKKAGISKGSLFKYFPTKEDFYFYVLDKIAAELITSLEEKINTLSTDLFHRNGRIEVNLSVDFLHFLDNGLPIHTVF